MIDYLSFINTYGEYAYDCCNRNDILLRVTTNSNVMLIKTNYDSIVVTSDTKILTAKNKWVQADSLKPGDKLKHDLMRTSVVATIEQYNCKDYNMLKIVDCKRGYLVVNGLFIARDMI